VVVVPQLTELIGFTIASIELSYGRLSLSTEQGHKLRVDNQVELQISKDFDTAPPAKITGVSETKGMTTLTFVGGELRILMASENFRSPEAFAFSMPDGSGIINRGDE
jgi:hypothetical protein